ncbi:F-box/LRR-repeat protein 13 [Quillaja saponaria]|uniref:F-box/LRR-repeat protein 13 n=1 Tax=Quillaja saponaria TaxID=32244 RepID=A0AAD7QDI7_QUISA|nr:F-box/LRR-repeat protein 13 [Quillaja saponaria]
MTVLRSQLVLPTKTTPRSAETTINKIEPAIPTLTDEPLSLQFPPSTSMNPSSSSLNTPSNSCPGISGTIRSRSLRRVPNESLIVIDEEEEEEEAGIDIVDEIGDPSMRVGANEEMGLDSIGKQVRVLEVKEGIEQSEVIFIDESDTDEGVNTPGFREGVQVSWVNGKNESSGKDNGDSRNDMSKDDNCYPFCLNFEFKMENLIGDVVGIDSFESTLVREIEEDKKGKRELTGCNGEGVVTENLEQGSFGYDSGTLKRRRISREEKGKGTLTDTDALLSTDIHEVKELDLISKINYSGEDANSHVNHLSDDVALQDEMQFMNISRNTSTREFDQVRNLKMGRFREIARENASRFAHFSTEAENENHKSPDGEVDREIEDWPGPFSTAIKIIKDRTLKSSQTVCSSSRKNVFTPITSVPSLQELCIVILAKHADAIVSLEMVPDALRNKLSQLLCDSRRMNSHFFDLLVRGSPTEICLKDCSWLTEEHFVKSFQGCDTSNLGVLQLDQCGRCIPDYVLLATIAQSSNKLPGLTTLSLTGACRLSDLGLSALVSSAPALRSINLSQCSLLTSVSINILADSLGSILRELYLDDCESIDAMLILPALKKLEHLEVLSVAGLQTVCDQFIREYITARGRSIKELVLTNCVKLTDSSLKVIAEQCPGLCALNLMNLLKLTDSSICYLANGCRAIHTLKLCRNAFSDEAIAAFLEINGDFLNELSLNNVKKVSQNTAMSLSRHGRRLHTLDLSWCRSLSDHAVGLIVDSCLSLRVLKLFGCTQITDVFLNGHSNSQMQIIGLKMTSLL